MKMIKNIVRAGVMIALPAAALAVTTPAQATLPTITFTCDKTLTTPDATNCAGYYSGNLLNGSSGDVQNQQDALALLGFTWDGNWNALQNSTNPDLVLVNGIDGLSGPNHDQLNFGTILSGLTIIGAHFGNVYGDAGNVSVFWLFDLVTPTDHITLDHPDGWSNAALYTTGTPPVPEPATWAMMMLGFAGIGLGMRRRRSHQTALTQIA
jgi:hypothetical protein